MRVAGAAVILCLAIVDLASAQTIDVQSAKQSDTPMYRPVLIGKGPNSLINRIDTQDLLNKGQKDAVIMFSCLVKKTGQRMRSSTYRATPNSKLLETELKKRLGDAVFIPAIYNHLPVDAIFYGTVIYAVVEGKPRLRIFSNQEVDELKKESDFIGPQPFIGLGSKFFGLHYPASSVPVRVDGTVDLHFKIDEAGNLQSLVGVAEEPPFLGFGQEAIDDFSKAKFIPAFRDGKPVACEITLPIFYKAE